MEFSDVPGISAPSRLSLARLSLAVGFGVAVAVASVIEAPAVIANLGPFGLFGIDKWIHAGSYALLAFLGAFVVLTRSVVALVAIAVLTTVFGAGVEVLQGFIAWRTMQFADVVANTLGALVGVGCWAVLWSRLPFELGAPAEA